MAEPVQHVRFQGLVVAVKPRIGLHRSFDQVWHSYHGYVLALENGARIAVGQAAHAKHRFRIGDFRCYWRAPAVALSGSTLARRLDDAASVVMSRARILRRPRRTSHAEMQLAIKGAGKQLRAIAELPKKQRRPLLDAVHLFVRATETSDLGTALLFYSGAVDRMTQLAPSRRIFSSAEWKRVRKAVRDVCAEDDEKQARADHLVKLLNDAPWKERLIRVAEAKDVALSKRGLADIERLYKMRNLLAHEGARPDSAINFQLRHGLAVLDRLISAWLPW